MVARGSGDGRGAGVVRPPNDGDVTLPGYLCGDVVLTSSTR